MSGDSEAKDAFVFDNFEGVSGVTASYSCKTVTGYRC